MAMQVLVNLILAFVWAFLNNDLTPVTFAVGYVLGFVLLFLLRRFLPAPFYGRRIVALVVLIGIFLKELILSNIDVIKHVAKPQKAFTPGIVALPIHLRSPREITTLANLISLTPGTLSVDVSVDNSTLYIHVLDISAAEEVSDDIKNTFEKRIREVTR